MPSSRKEKTLQTDAAIPGRRKVLGQAGDITEAAPSRADPGKLIAIKEQLAACEPTSASYSAR